MCQGNRTTGEKSKAKQKKAKQICVRKKKIQLNNRKRFDAEGNGKYNNFDRFLFPYFILCQVFIFP